MGCNPVANAYGGAGGSVKCVQSAQCASSYACASVNPRRSRPSAVDDLNLSGVAEINFTEED